MKILLTISSFLLFNFYSSAQAIKKIKTNELVKLIDTSNCPLVINFWASWCRPCVAEIPILEKNILPLKSNGVKLILINLNSASDYYSNLQPFIESHNYQSQIFWLNEINMHQFFSIINKRWSGTIPATLMINNANHYREFYGYGLAEYQIQAYIKDLIGR